MIDNKFVTVATNSVPAANAVLNRKGLKLLMVGGAVEADLAECVDAHAVLAVQKMNIDHCFLGACAVSSKLELGGFNPADTLFKRVLISRSQKVPALDKLETRAPARHRPARVPPRVGCSTRYPLLSFSYTRKSWYHRSDCRRATSTRREGSMTCHPSLITQNHV